MRDRQYALAESGFLGVIFADWQDVSGKENHRFGTMTLDWTFFTVLRSVSDVGRL